MTDAPTEVEEERHASWAELFFDLVVVAGVGTLAHVIHDDVTGGSLALYGVLFLAFWLCWTSFMLYGNASGENTRTGHLSERLSLFVIIVLGEGVIQCVDAAFEAEWGRRLFTTGAAAFVLLAGMWALSGGLRLCGGAAPAT